MKTCLLRLLAALLAWICWPAAAAGEPPAACRGDASDACYFSFQPAPAAGQMHYFASLPSHADARTAAPTSALIVVHGHPRDANITFDAALAAATAAKVDGTTVIVAPVFQVAAGPASRCSTNGVPPARDNDLLWTCASWMDGGGAENAPSTTSFAATDALVDEVLRRWPSVRVITVAGFSAGAQMVQHYIGFAAVPRRAGIALRYVVADPGTWLYFDSVRPVSDMDGQTAPTTHCAAGYCNYRLAVPDASCSMANQWKYGTEGLAITLHRSASAARAIYASADVHYLEGAQDSGIGPGKYSRILDKSCAAQLQGSFRLQRGLAYAAYDRQRLAPDSQRRVIVIPGCAHDVTCVWTSPAARNALFGIPR